jgi:multidrug resistance efflux pump
LRTGIPKLESAITKIDDGLAKARSQRNKLHKAKSKIIEARGDLRRTRKLAVVAAEAATLGIDVAKNQKLLATVIAPASGVVVEAAKVGDVVAPGATVARIREGDANSVTTWLSPAQLSEVCLGSRAAVRADWMSNPQWLDAEITLIGHKADYPPTSFATNEVHLTRAVPVRLTLTRSSAQSQSLPPGAPVDLTFLAANDDSCSTKAAGR